MQMCQGLSPFVGLNVTRKELVLQKRGRFVFLPDLTNSRHPSLSDTAFKKDVTNNPWIIVAVDHFPPNNSLTESLSMEPCTRKP